jgi:hypothetical protein
VKTHESRHCEQDKRAQNREHSGTLTA